jgi:hypothetical protein
MTKAIRGAGHRAAAVVTGTMTTMTVGVLAMKDVAGMAIQRAIRKRPVAVGKNAAVAGIKAVTRMMTTIAAVDPKVEAAAMADGSVIPRAMPKQRGKDGRTSAAVLVLAAVTRTMMMTAGVLAAAGAVAAEKVRAAGLATPRAIRKRPVAVGVTAKLQD